MRQAFRGDASSCSRSNHDGPKGDESLLGAGVQHFSTRRDSLQLDGLGWHRRSAAARPVRSNYSYCWIAGMVFGDAGTTVPDGARIRQHHNAASMGLWLHQRAYSMFQARGRPFPCPNLCAPCRRRHRGQVRLRPTRCGSFVQRAMPLAQPVASGSRRQSALARSP
jgi:hypothetical protein